MSAPSYRAIPARRDPTQNGGMPPHSKGMTHLLPILLLIVGVFACSTSVIMIKASEVHPAVLSAWRLLIAAAALSPLFIIAWRRERQAGNMTWRNLLPSVLPAGLLALHFISWAAGARMTLAANATLIVNMVPIVMPFFLFFLIREKINRAEVIGTLLAIGGVFVLAWGDYRLDSDNLPGDFVCFISMLLFALYLAFGRVNRGIRSLWLYLVPLYAIAGLLCLILSLPVANPFAPIPGREVFLLIGMGLIPTVLGHSLLNYALKHIGGQAVSVCNLGQFVFAGCLAFLVFAEVPHMPFYIAAALVLAGAGTVIHSAPRMPVSPTAASGSSRLTIATTAASSRPGAPDQSPSGPPP